MGARACSLRRDRSGPVLVMPVSTTRYEFLNGFLTRTLFSFPFCSFRKELGDVTPHNIRQLKKLNSVVFPISYTDKVGPFSLTNL